MRPASLAASFDEAVGEEFSELSLQRVRVGAQLAGGLGERKRFVRLKKRGESGGQWRKQHSAGFIRSETFLEDARLAVEAA